MMRIINDCFYVDEPKLNFTLVAPESPTGCIIRAVYTPHAPSIIISSSCLPLSARY